MTRLIILTAFFLLSLLTAFRAPTNFLWLVSILVTEFCWIFFAIVCVLIIWRFGSMEKYNIASAITGIAALIMYSLPIAGAYKAAKKASSLFPHVNNSADVPFSFWKMVSSFGEKEMAYTTLTYDQKSGLTLDFYKSIKSGRRPCIVVVHGGSWAGGDSRQLPELNTRLAKSGYNVASINYRLAPKFHFPAPIEDVQSAISFLRNHAADLAIDTSNFVLLGRSAGGQIVLSANSILNDPGIRGIINFYGPADMVWGYANPANPLVLNSRKVMEEYLGGTYDQVPQQFVKSSATETASPHMAPVLSINGEDDPLVSHKHSIRLAPKLDEAGVKHYELYLPWATHGFDWSLNGPGGQISTWCVFRFIEQVTKK